MKEFSKIEINTIKSIAKNVAPYVAKKEKINQQIADVEETIRKKIVEKVEKLNVEKKTYQDIIDSMNATVKRITGGYTTEDLVEKKMEGTGKFDEKGKEIMKSYYTLKYPDTVVPPTEDNVVPPTTEDVAGSDYDKDVENLSEERDEYPEELAQEAVEAKEEVINSDPFEDVDPFN